MLRSAQINLCKSRQTRLRATKVRFLKFRPREVSVPEFRTGRVRAVKICEMKISFPKERLAEISAAEVRKRKMRPLEDSSAEGRSCQDRSFKFRVRGIGPAQPCFIQVRFREVAPLRLASRRSASLSVAPGSKARLKSALPRFARPRPSPLRSASKRSGRTSGCSSRH